MTSLSHVPDALKGVIGIKVYYDYQVSHSTKGRQFQSQWANQSYTGEIVNNGVNQCNNELDSQEGTFLYQNVNGSICSGLNFSTYSSDIASGGKEFNDNAPYVYDAVFALAQGMDNVIKSNLEFNTENLYTSMLNASFQGATGNVSFFPGVASDAYFRQGDRLDVPYEIWNYHIRENDFVQVAMWSASDGVVSCPSDLTCSSFEYNSEDTSSPVSDTQSDVYDTLPSSSKTLLIVLGVLMLLTAATFSTVVYVFSGRKLVKSAQPVMIACRLFGVVIGALKVLIASFPITDTSCIAGSLVPRLFKSN